MLLTKPALSLWVLVSSVVGQKEPSKYYATLGEYGTFQLEISADDGTMTWKSDLSNIDSLAAELNITAGITSLTYHLHQSWILPADFATGADCGLLNLGNQYDPYFACGPASGNSDAACNALGRARNAMRYACSGSYPLGNYNECEVGDLSGKEGSLVVGSDGKASGSPALPDPLAALDTEYVGDRTTNPPSKWASIVFHNGSPRVLCGKNFAGALLPPPCDVEFILVDADADTPLRPLEAEECLAPFKYTIEVRPTAGCLATSSARIVLSTGATVVKDREENSAPFSLFGDRGKAMVEGNFTVTARLFSGLSLQGDLVVERSLDFSVVDFSRRLRGTVDPG